MHVNESSGACVYTSCQLYNFIRVLKDMNITICTGIVFNSIKATVVTQLSYFQLQDHNYIPYYSGV